MGSELVTTLPTEMILIIAGGRDYELTVRDYARLNRLLSEVTEVVSGGARGADLCGETWAICNKIPVKHFAAEWELYGKSAGHRRNWDMAHYADALAIFPGGKGTKHMFEAATKVKLEIFDFRENALF